MCCGSQSESGVCFYIPLISDVNNVYFRAIRGEIPPKILNFLPKMLKHMINYTLNAKFHPQ